MSACATKNPDLRHQVGWASRPARGFTLIEALASLMLVAVVLPFVMRGVALSARSAADADRKAYAMSLAETQMNEVVLSQAWQFGSADGAFGEQYGKDAERYTWALTAVDWKGADFKELTLAVLWQEGNRDRRVELKTVVYAGAG